MNYIYLSSLAKYSCMYYEQQRFRQKWLKAVLYFLLAVSLILGYIIAKQKIMNDWFTAFLPVALIVLLIVLFNFMELHTRIEATGICYRFPPLLPGFRCIEKGKIENITVIRYHPIADYGGWGIRFSRKGRAYTTSGIYGIQIRLLTGKKILLGTQRPEEVYEALYGHGYAPEKMF